MPSVAAMTAGELVLSLASECSNARRFSSSTGGRPPWRPRARAAESPAIVRSRIRSRSNSASALNTWKMSRPPLVVVSMLSCSERNPTRRSRSSCTLCTRSTSERPNRSSFHTTMVSPLRAKARASVRPGRSAFAPPATSVNTLRQPARLSSSRWRSSFWSAVETRAYPMSMEPGSQNAPTAGDSWTLIFGRVVRRWACLQAAD
jgi:hypothetical protein